MDETSWRHDVFPNDLGDHNHRWSWLMRAGAEEGEGRDLLWLHRCTDGKWSVAWIDLTSGEKHRLVQTDPLTIEPSVLCPAGCGDHGYVRNGRWESA